MSLRTFTAALLVGAGLSLASASSAMQPASSSKSAAAELPTEAFARLPYVEKASLSPDGSHISGLFAINGQQRIVIVPAVGDRSKIVTAGIPDKTEVAWLRWANNDNIIVGLYALVPVQGNDVYVSRLAGINRTTGKITKLLWTLNGQNAADVLWTPADGSNDILVAGQDSIYLGQDFWPVVYRVDVTDGRYRPDTKGRTNVLSWGADHLGRVRYGIGYQDATTQANMLYRSDGESMFRSIARASLLDDEDLVVPFIFLPGTDKGYAIKKDSAGRRVVAEVDLAAGNDVRTVYAADDADIDSVYVSADASKMLGFETRRSVHWVDSTMAAHQKTLDATSASSTVRIESYNSDLTKLLVRVSTPDNPGILFYFDSKTGNLARLAAANDIIGSKRLSRSKLVKYRARDGLEIEGVLTMPRHRSAKNLPFIVMPHGGPWAHDELTYDYWTQFLAERGYAVLQPNFRGSTGYGDKFLKAGEGQLGFAMQDDVSDGVRWAVAQGIADPKRVCIVGASYGGYAAMWGVAKDPDLYRCAVSINGVSSLRREVNDFGDAFHGRLYRGQWKKMTPDFAAVSPINAIARIKAPLLLIHGKKDVTVNHGQSASMYSAMTRAGKTAEFVSIPLADHYFTREADRLTLLKSIETFLDKHNPAD